MQGYSFREGRLWQMFTELMEYMSLGIGFIGVVVIASGTVHTLFQFIRIEVRQFKGVNVCQKRELIRQHYGSYILLGLEFFIAADIVHTITQPGLKELAALGAIVAIRTILSYFLNREMEVHSCRYE